MKPKLLGLITFGVVPMSTQHGRVCGISAQFGYPILVTLTKVDGEVWPVLIFCNQYKS